MKQPLAGNPHFTAANYGEIPAEPFAIAQATLALAHEQRIANLIAWHAVVDGSEPVAEELHAAIHEGLGLKS
ncbi:hypothetical protein SEA_HIRKO_47 [Arthrobacter phage Hirko]|nr:hypothetical protein SEA_HIRKO_47 [Arthrobacter phage Hirko]